MRFLPVLISAHAFVMNPSWLIDGWALRCNPSMPFKRDYFLPLPNADASGVRHVMAEYAALVSLSTCFLIMLQVLHGKAQHGCQVVLCFWTEHSERNWLVSILAALGVSREKGDYVGRWRVISASDEHSRIAQFLVYHRKKKLCEG